MEVMELILICVACCCRCGPGPTENGTVLNGDGFENGHGYATTDTEGGFDHMSSAAPSEMQVRL